MHMVWKIMTEDKKYKPPTWSPLTCGFSLPGGTDDLEDSLSDPGNGEETGRMAFPLMGLPHSIAEHVLLWCSSCEL